MAYVILTLALVTGIARAQGDRRDGNWWLQFTSEQRLFYVTGFLDGSDFGADDAIGRLNAKLFSPFTGPANCLPELTKWGLQFGDELSAKPVLSGPTAGQLVQGIDKLYGDFRNRRIPLVLMMRVVLESIEGSSDADIDKRLQYFRKESAK